MTYYVVELTFRFLHKTTHADWLLNRPRFSKHIGPIQYVFHLQVLAVKSLS